MNDSIGQRTEGKTMDIVDEIKREIARTELLNDMAEGMTAPKSTAMLTAAISEIERLRKALEHKGTTK